MKHQMRVIPQIIFISLLPFDGIVKKEWKAVFFSISQFLCIVRTYFVPGGIAMYRQLKI